MYGAGRQGADGTFKRGHAKAASSFSGWSNTVPPLSIGDTLALHGQFALRGLKDAAKLSVAIEKLSMDKIVAANIVKSSVMQGVVLVSALAIKPMMRSIFGARGGFGSAGVYVLFHLLWLYPIAIAATYYSGLLRPLQETDRRSSRAGVNPNDYRGMTAKVATESYRALVTVNYFVVVVVLRWIPWFGAPIAFIYASIVDSYFCWEQHWLKSGWPFGERVKQLDSRWAYHAGFGLPITIISWWSSEPIVNLALFALFYPFFQLMAASSLPQPLDASMPTSAVNLSFMPKGGGSFSMAAAEGGEENRGRRGHPLIPTRIRVLIFAEVVYSILIASFSGKKKDAGSSSSGGAGYGHRAQGGPSQFTQQHQQHQQHQPMHAPVSNTYDPYADPYGQPQQSEYQQESQHDANFAGYASADSPYSQHTRVYGHAQHTTPRKGHAASESTTVLNSAGSSNYAPSNNSAYGSAAFAPTPSTIGAYGTPTPAAYGGGPAAPAYGISTPNQSFGAPPASAGGGGYSDRNLDNLIKMAAGRKKGD